MSRVVKEGESVKTCEGKRECQELYRKERVSRVVEEGESVGVVREGDRECQELWREERVSRFVEEGGSARVAHVSGKRVFRGFMHGTLAEGNAVQTTWCLVQGQTGAL